MDVFDHEGYKIFSRNTIRLVTEGGGQEGAKGLHRDRIRDL